MSKVPETKAGGGSSTGKADPAQRGAARIAQESEGGRSSVGSEIIAALREVAEVLQTGEPLERRFTVRRYRLNVAPRPYSPDDVRRVRESLNLSQSLFAQFLGASLAAVRSWEQGKRPPSPLACRFLDEIATDPPHWRKRLIALSDVEELRP
jgi:putative transcriptional regulator